MIQQTLVMLLLLTFTQAIAAMPCPTCPKGYAISSMEEALISRQKEKGPSLKKVSEGSVLTGKIKESIQEGLRATNTMNRTSQNIYRPHVSRSRAPKRDEILRAIGASPKLAPAGDIYFSQEQNNQNLRGTGTMAFGKQQQLRQHLRNLKR